MTDQIVHSSKSITLLGGGEARAADLAEALSLAPRLICADGGAVRALELGYEPDAVFGDLDSLPEDVAARLPDGVLRRVEEQDSTDFDKTLRHVSAPLILAAGFLGGRMDHALANCTILVRRADRPCILIGSDDVICAARPEMALNLPVGSRLSLFPLAPVSGFSEGLEWPISGIGFSPDGRIGTSNRVTGPVRLAFDAPGMLLVLPRAALGAMIAAIT
ncbi:thiamine diphosphokinase [Roseicyclus sp. F158]|uniref:Thiamine diphosphokinase n=1 Tax=Tropicimonas omnivorans TaxID=3075590 RepID=A0ABU3DFK3_9RHOB|nr:thiamine diphosphokinase [Roseicyclus sp. F158]MDT0682333.1 thiamine diphosphokinase [Roseicyclus sp. F158]